MNKKKIFIVIGIFWLLILSSFVVFKEFTLRTGNEVLLKTIPVDPRDLFRGDYVILRYNINTIDINKFDIKNSIFKKGDKIYVSLNINNGKVISINNIYKNKPSNEIFIKGTIKNIYKNKLNINYGIESYFVPEGKGREIEKNIKKIYAKIAIDKFGNALIKTLILDGKEINL